MNPAAVAKVRCVGDDDIDCDILLVFGGLCNCYFQTTIRWSVVSLPQANFQSLHDAVTSVQGTRRCTQPTSVWLRHFRQRVTDMVLRRSEVEVGDRHSRTCALIIPAFVNALHHILRVIAFMRPRLVEQVDGCIPCFSTVRSKRLRSLKSYACFIRASKYDVRPGHTACVTYRIWFFPDAKTLEPGLQVASWPRSSTFSVDVALQLTSNSRSSMVLARRPDRGVGMTLFIA